MWFSFLTNILILVTAIILFIIINREQVQKYFMWFVLLTGIAAGIAAFGHLEILPLSIQKALLFVSRIVNIAAIFSFTSGTFRYFKLIDTKWIKRTNNSVFLFFICWIGIENVFLPVTYYGILGLAVVSMGIFIKNLNVNKAATIPVIIGISIIILSAFVFYVVNASLPFTPADISHILISFALVIMARGFKRMDLYDVST